MLTKVEDRSAQLKKFRLRAVKAAQAAYEFGEANAYTYDAMLAIMLLDAELNNFLITPKRGLEKLVTFEETAGPYESAE
jgi:hypothetical protein